VRHLAHDEVRASRVSSDPHEKRLLDAIAPSKGMTVSAPQAIERQFLANVSPVVRDGLVPVRRVNCESFVFDDE
jgi:hypothetical protein